MELPQWMLAENAPPKTNVRPSGTGFLAKTLRRASQVFENEFYGERSAALPMLLQGIDARVKLLVLLGFAVYSAFAGSIAVLLALSVIALVYASLSGLRVRDFARRVWAYIPVLALLFSLPGASSLFTKGPPLFYLLPPGACGLQDGLYFSAAGLLLALRLALRPGVSISFAFLLLLTTRWSRLTAALARLRVPALFVAVLSMAYRYIFILTEMLDNMLLARAKRTVGRLSAAENRRFMSRSAAYLFLRAHRMSEDVYDAMVCRGFTGTPAPARRMRCGAADLLFALMNALILLLLIAGDRLF